MSGVHTDLILCSLTPLTFTSVPVMYVKAVTDYSPPPSLPPPRRQGRPDSDWWASLTFVFDMERRPAGGAVHLACHRQTWGVTLRGEKSGPPYVNSLCPAAQPVEHQLRDMSDSKSRSLRLGQNVKAALQELSEELRNSINDYWI